MPDWQQIAGALAAADLKINAQEAPIPLHGGDISDAWRVSTAAGDIFLKTGPASEAAMFAAERDGLNELAGANAVRTPKPMATGRSGADSYLALEWLNLATPPPHTHRIFGQQLATLHRCFANEHGWFRDNTIGRTPQPNSPHNDWVEFFREQRLEHQLKIAADNGYGGELQSRGAWLCKHLHTLFDGYEPAASLLHGDLWGGNWGCCDGEPVMFDPATYYGDRETDIAMTRLFGSFHAEFYEGYDDVWPLNLGSVEREPLYKLYHVLNHLNLFGGSYLAQSLSIMHELRRTIEAAR